MSQENLVNPTGLLPYGQTNNELLRRIGYLLQSIQGTDLAPVLAAILDSLAPGSFGISSVLGDTLAEAYTPCPPQAATRATLWNTRAGIDFEVAYVNGGSSLILKNGSFITLNVTDVSNLQIKPTTANAAPRLDIIWEY